MARAKGPGQSALLLLDVLSALEKRHIPYAIIGAFAVSYYGVVRASLDADAVISLPSAGAGVEALAGGFRDAHLKVKHRRGNVGDPVGAVLSAEDRFGNQVDLLMGIRGMGEDAFRRTVRAKFMGRAIRMISPEDLVAMKLFAGSPKDLGDAAGVLEVSGNRLDRPLLRRLARGYGAAVLKRLESLLKRRIG